MDHDNIIHIRVSDIGDFENKDNYAELEFDYKAKEYYHTNGRDLTELEQVFVTGFISRYEDALIKSPHALGKLTVVPVDDDDGNDESNQSLYSTEK